MIFFVKVMPQLCNIDTSLKSSILEDLYLRYSLLVPVTDRVTNMTGKRYFFLLWYVDEERSNLCYLENDWCTCQLANRNVLLHFAATTAGLLHVSTGIEFRLY